MVRSDMAHMTMCVDFGHQPDEVPERVVRAGRLRIAAVGLHLHGMDQVGELDRVLDEEHRDVVADQVPVALLGVELDGEAAHVARRVDRACAAGDRREAGEYRRLLADLGQDLRAWCIRRAIRSARSSRAPPSRGHARCARECARDRSAGSSRAGRSLRAVSARAAGPAASSGCRRRARPGWWSAAVRAARGLVQFAAVAGGARSVFGAGAGGARARSGLCFSVGHG